MQKDKTLVNFLVEKRFYVIAFAWLILQVFIYWQFGIVENFEAAKYIVEAENLVQNGSYSSGNFLFYSVQIILIALSKWTHSYPWLPLMFQLGFNAVSVFCFFRLARLLGASYLVSTMATVFFLAMYFYHSYNFHLFTESLYYSFGIIYTYFLFRLSKINLKNIFLVILFLSLLYFTRPNGIFFIPATVVFIVFRFYRQKAILLLGTAGIISILVIYLLLNYALSSGGEFDFLLPFREAHIICGVPTVSQPYPIIIPFNYNSLEGFWYLLTNHTGLFSELAWKKLIAFWGVTRSYYSTFHNVFLVIYFYPLYLLMIRGIAVAYKHYRAQFLFMLLLILFAMVTVLFSCDDWHNRFILALLPWFILLAIVRKPLNS